MTEGFQSAPGRALTAIVAVVASVCALLPALFITDASAAELPTRMVFSTQPGNGDPGDPFIQPTVTLQRPDPDHSGQWLTASSTAAVTLTLNPQSIAGGGTYVAGTLSGCSATTTAGVAAFSGCEVSAAGKYTVTAHETTDNLTTVESSVFYISGPAQLVFTTQPGGGAAGTSWSSGNQPVVKVKDAQGNVVTGITSQVGVAIQNGTGTSGATLTCHKDGVPDNVIHFVAGVASFTECKIDKSGSDYQLYAVDPTHHLISAPSSNFDISAGDIDHLSFTAQPAGAVGGVAFTQQPVVTLQDAGGNTVSSTHHVTLTKQSGPSGGALSCTSSDVAAVAGVATFAGCKLDKAGTYTLRAEDSTAGTHVDSQNVVVTTGTASQISFKTQPAGAAPGAAFTTQPVVRVTDLGGNPVSASVQLAIKTGTGTSGAALSCAPAVTVSGDATFSGCSIDKAGSGYKLTATSGSLSVDSSVFTVETGTAAAVNFQRDPDETGNTGGTAFDTQPKVKITDAGGAAVGTGSITLSIEPGTGTPGATLTCAENPTNVESDGVATFSGCRIDKDGHGYRLRATLTGSSTIHATGSAFNIAVGDPAQIAFTAQPDSGTGGVAWDTQPVVTVEDAGGNPVSDATGDLTLGLDATTGDGTLSCQDLTIPVQDARAMYADCSIDQTASAYRLTASWNALDTSSDTFAITAGPAVALQFTQQPDGAIANSAFSTQPTVAFKDVGGNTTTVGAGTVSLAIASGSGTDTAALSCIPSSGATGTAAFAGCSINLAGAGYSLTATHGVLSAESLPFSVVTAPPATGNAPYAVPLAETFGGGSYGANPTTVVDDVNTATGSLTFASTDLRVAGIGKPFMLARTYNSADSTGGFFGPGWSSMFDVGVNVRPKTDATLRGEDGQQTVWKWNSKKSSFLPPAGARGLLVCGGNTGNHCRYTRTDGSYWDVNDTAPGGGQLQTYKGDDNNGLTFDWTTDQVTVTVTSDTETPYRIVGTIANGRITHLQTPAGRSVDYTYDGAGRLTSVTDTAGRTWTYGYGTADRLVSQTDPDGNVRLAASYADGKVSSVSAKGSSKHTDDDFTYATTNGVTTTTRAVHEAIGGSDATANYTYKYKNNSLIEQGAPSGARIRYSYDAFGNLTTVVDPLGWVTTLAYSAANDLVRQTDALGNPVLMTYDNQHRITSQTDAAGNLTKYGYSGPYLTSITQPPGTKSSGVTTLTYNGRGLLSMVTGPLGKQSFDYDAFGNRTSSHLLTLGGAAVNGPGTSMTYDEGGRRLTSTDADGRTTTWTYNNAGDMLSMENADGQVTTYEHTGAADLERVTTPTHTTEYAWNEGTLTQTTTVDGSASKQVFDASGHTVQEKVGDTVSKDNVYDATGRLVQQTDASGVTTRFTYDLANNAVLVTSSVGDVLRRQYDALSRQIRQVLDGAVTKTKYDKLGNVKKSVDPALHETSYLYNAINQVSAITTSAGTTSYAYDLDGNLLTLTDPKGHKTTYTYDAANRRTSMTFAGNTTTYGHDHAGNVVSTTDAEGRQTSYVLDALNRATTTTYSWNGDSFDVTQQYDADGRRTRMVDPTGTHDYTYDASGHLTSVAYNDDTFSYDYSTAGKIVETYPDGTEVAYGVDDTNNVMSVDSGTKGQDDYVHAAYLRNGQRFTSGLAYSNGVLETRQLDQAGHVLAQNLSVGGEPAADDAFTYDAAGERLTQIDNVAGQVTTNTYAYDGAGRLTGFDSDSATTHAIDWPAVDLSGDVPSGAGEGLTPQIPASVPVSPDTQSSTTHGYSYDANGNRTSDSVGGSHSYTNDAADGLTSTNVGGSRSMTYDNTGNLTGVTDGAGTESLTYDAANRLVGVDLPGGSHIHYTYDGDGNRVSKTIDGDTTDYIWDPASARPQLAIERTGGGDLIRRYFYGDGPVAMQTPTATFFYHLDPQGSVMELTDGTGGLAAAYHYDGFGVLSSTDGASPPDNPLLFQSGYLDADSGLYLFGARNYDAALGRFTQRDPLERPAGIPFVSSYVFVDDRPTMFVDPTGQYEAQDVFWSHNTVEANAAMLTSYSLTAANAAYKVGGEIAQLVEAPAEYVAGKWESLQELGGTVKQGAIDLYNYVKQELTGSTESAVEEIADNIGEAAGAETEAAVEVLERSGGEIGELGAEAGEVAGESAEVLAEAGEAAKFGGYALAVIGIGLQTFITVEDCMHDTVTKCVADTVGLAVAVGFIVGCEVASLGAATPICGLVGAAISVGLTEIIARYGPEIAAGFVSGYNATVSGLTTAADWVASTSTMVGDQIVTGYNTAITALKSGFNDAIDTLVDAGYTAGEIAKTLANSFVSGVEAIASELVGLGYGVADIAVALYDALGVSLDVAVQTLKDTYNFTVTQISNAVVDAYNAAAADLGAALKAADYAVDQVASGLKSAYNDVADWTDAAVADVLDGLDYSITQITSALQDVYDDADQAVAVILKDLDYGAQAVAGALESFYNDLDDEAAAALEFADYTVNQIAGALEGVYDDAAAITASILQDLSHTADEIAGAMQSVYDLASTATAQILKDLSYDATVVAGALVDAYDTITQQLVTDALYVVGYAVDAVSNALQATYDALDGVADDVADLLYTAGFALVDVGTALADTLDKIDSEVVALLDGLSGVSLADASAALLSIFDNETVQDVAEALQAAFYDVSEIAGVLQDAFDYAADAAAQLLVDIGVELSDIIDVLGSVWGAAEDAIASILTAIAGLDLGDIADAMMAFFGDTAGEIANLFSSIGITTDLINDIGGAFEDFGNAVASGVEDAWDEVSSWF